jgi:hypothetical protein
MATKYTPTTDETSDYELNDFYEACGKVRETLGQLNPNKLLYREQGKVNVFATRMAAAGYRAIAAGLDEVANDAENGI